jgi:hypothetical protein
LIARQLTARLAAIRALESAAVRNVLACFLFVLRHCDRQILRAWYMALPAHSSRGACLSQLVQLLQLVIETFTVPRLLFLNSQLINLHN